MRLMAVWKYGQPPYYLAAEIEEMKDDGTVKVKDYGFWTKPVKILPFNQGRIDNLKALGLKYEDQRKQLQENIRHDAMELLSLT